MKEITFKLIHKSYLAKAFLRKYKSDSEVNLCFFSILLKKTSFICFGNVPTQNNFGQIFHVHPMNMKSNVFILF